VQKAGSDATRRAPAAYLRGRHANTCKRIDPSATATSSARVGNLDKYSWRLFFFSIFTYLPTRQTLRLRGGVRCEVCRAQALRLTLRGAVTLSAPLAARAPFRPALRRLAPAVLCEYAFTLSYVVCVVCVCVHACMYVPWLRGCRMRRMCPRARHTATPMKLPQIAHAASRRFIPCSIYVRHRSVRGERERRKRKPATCDCAICDV
jgi:hypothetical protein